MLKTYKNILITFPILILAWGCYTTSQHPLVHFDDDDGRLNVFTISVYDECKDCHDADALEDMQELHKPMLAAISNYNYDYYSGNYELENYYNEKPWWFEYKFNLILDDEKKDEPEIIIYRNDNYRGDYHPEPPVILVPPPATTPPKYRNPDSNKSNDRINVDNSNQKRTDPNPRQRDGGGRGNSNGRK
jgi:hypothetical protein